MGLICVFKWTLNWKIISIAFWFWLLATRFWLQAYHWTLSHWNTVSITEKLAMIRCCTVGPVDLRSPWILYQHHLFFRFFEDFCWNILTIFLKWSKGNLFGRESHKRIAKKFFSFDEFGKSFVGMQRFTTNNWRFRINGKTAWT